MDPLKNYNKNFKSDRRVTGGKSGFCPLCEEEKKLILSHVAPKWCYQWAKKEGEGTIIGDYPSIGVRVREQDGSKHYMLCPKCDQFLGDAENYIKVIMHGSENELQKKGIDSDITYTKNEIYHGINIELVQRFLLGLVFKSHYATSAPFHKIKVKERELKLVRSRLLIPVEEDLDYPIISIKYYSDYVPDVDPKAMMYPQQLKNDTGEYFFSFLIAGWEWIIFLNEKRTLKTNLFLRNRLQIPGKLIALTGDILDQRHVNRGKPFSRRQLRELKRRKK